ncbi:MAG: FmdB family zinc ribbon protein [Anaerolineaceae bacterium]
MPIYTYRCENCGVQFDRTQKFTDNPLVQCPECGKKTLRKVYTPVGIVFKGSGFYATDHHSASGQSWASGSKSTDPAETKTESKSDHGTESKAEPKKEAAKPAESTSSSESKAAKTEKS